MRMDEVKGCIDHFLARARKLAASRKVRTASIAIVLPLFTAALVLAWGESDVSIENLALGPVLVAVGLVPISVIASTWQLRSLTHLAGERVGWWDSARVVTLGTLSSLLPVSSGTIVRGSALVYWGVPARRAGQVLIYDVLIWMCLSLLFAGCAAFLAEATTVALFFLLGAGAVILPLCIIIGRWFGGPAHHGSLIAARASGVVALTLQLQACFWALGDEIGFVSAASLAAAPPLASLLFFLPGSLGVQEAFVAAVATAVGMSAAMAFLAAVLARLLGFATLLTWELGLLVLPEGVLRAACGPGRSDDSNHS